jgi:hypothetical protein
MLGIIVIRAFVPAGARTQRVLTQIIADDDTDAVSLERIPEKFLLQGRRLMIHANRVDPHALHQLKIADGFLSRILHVIPVASTNAS